MPSIATAYTLTFTINTSVTNTAQIGDAHNLTIWMPAAWTTATMAVQLARTTGTPSAGDWRTLTDGTAEVALPAAANRVIVLSRMWMIPNGAYWLRLVSGTVAAQVNQTAERVLTLEARNL